MTRFSIGLVTLLALSSAISMVQAHNGPHGHDHDEDPPVEFYVPEEQAYPAKSTYPVPAFEATTIKAPFLEQFAVNWSDRWTASEAKKDTDEEGQDFSYTGEWVAEEPLVYPGLSGDLGLVAKSAATHHAISASLPQAVDNTDKTLVVQYEVKAQSGLECGGAYMKLLTESPEGVKFKEFSDKTPYTIMFGPDKCGGTNKVHFIFRHKNPITGIYEEKHLQNAPLAKVGPVSSLYTLIVKPDQTFEIKINNEPVSSGSLLEDFQPPVNPEKEIDDASDSKPVDWVEDVMIADPVASKPADWDESAPATIVDETAVKPTNWLDDEEADIDDPDAVKPEDWFDEEDGEWTPPTIPNPKCQSNGCGKWVRPTKANPAYKGKWSAPLIPNPAYKGSWAPRKIANPDFFEDLKPSSFEKIGAVGFEIWTMQKDILFDNIYIGHSVNDAEALAAESWEIKYKNEKAQDEIDHPPPKTIEQKSFSDDPVGYSIQQLREFIVLVREDPMDAINSKPMVTAALAGIVGVSFGLFLIIMGFMTASPDATAAAKKTDAVTADDDEDKAAAAGPTEDSEFEEEETIRKRASNKKASVEDAEDE